MEYSQSSESIYKGLVVLFDDDRIRYGRQIAYPGFGEEGQEKLKSSHAAVLGQADWGVPPRSIWHTPVLGISLSSIAIP
jgi:hypothetical protein